MLVTVCHSRASMAPCLSWGWDMTFFPHVACFDFCLCLAHPASSPQLSSLQASLSPSSPMFPISVIPLVLMASEYQLWCFHFCLLPRTKCVWFYTSENKSHEKRTRFKLLFKNLHVTYVVLVASWSITKIWNMGLKVSKMLFPLP